MSMDIVARRRPLLAGFAIAAFLLLATSLSAQAEGTPGGPSTFMNIVDKLAHTSLSTMLIVCAICTFGRVLIHVYFQKADPYDFAFGARVGRFFNELFDALVFAGGLIFLIVRPFVLQTFFVPTPSMVSTLMVNDYLIVNKAIFRYTDPQFHDIVVFRAPKEALFGNQAELDFVKRLVGMPGDIIEIRAGQMMRNGQPVQEPYLREPMTTDFKLVKYEGSRQEWAGKYIPVTVFGDIANDFQRTSKDYAVKPGKDTFLPPADPTLTEEDLRVMQELKDAPPAAIPPGHYLMMGDNRNQSFDSRGWGLVQREAIIGRADCIWFPIGRWRMTR